MIARGTVLVLLLKGLLSGGALPLAAGAEPSRQGTEYFENKIRPILAEHCYSCHSSARGQVKGGLQLDWKGGWQQGGHSGPALVPFHPDRSLLVRAVRYADPDLRMPPDGRRLSSQQVAALAEWVRIGAPDPRVMPPDSGSGPEVARGKEHWAFQPVTRHPPPSVQQTAWVRNDMDRFILAKLEANGLSPNPTADKRTLLRRVFFDLIGLPPTPDQVRAFESDSSPQAFERRVDELLASPQYGERWARHWLDVARYSDAKGQPDRRRESSVYPYAWTYRDYVIDSFNQDKPFHRFIIEQLAADRLTLGTNQAALAALGFLTVGDRYNGNTHEIVNDRIDVTTKAFLGLTVSCARCHDHKFDPIPQADYYSLHGIFASSVEPLLKPEISTARTSAEARDYQVWRAQLDDRLAKLRAEQVSEAFGDYRRLGGVYLYATRLPEAEREDYVRKMGGVTNVLRAWQQVTRAGGSQASSVFGLWNALARIPEARFAAQAPRLIASGSNSARPRGWHPEVMKAFQVPPRTLAQTAVIYGGLLARQDPAWQTLVSTVLAEAALRVLPPRQRNQFFALREQSDVLEMMHPGAPGRAPVLADSPAPRDSPVLIRGEAGNRGPVAPRRFLEVLSGPERPLFRNGSGRLELAQAIASAGNPLTARVLVNRVWMHHFGEGLVTTPDDFGRQSDPPSHPELLDYLAGWFMAEGWSIKKLHKLMLLSATYQQGSQAHPAAAEKDPFNRWLARANIRRLEFEPMRDSILFFGGGLDMTLGGHPVDLSQGKRPSRSRLSRVMDRIPDFRLAGESRRTLYAFVDRADLLEEFNIFDVPNPSAPFGRRYETIAPPQALYLMNSPAMIEQVRRVLQRPEFRTARTEAERVEFLYQLYFQRSPLAAELQAAIAFVEGQRKSVAAGAPVPARRLTAWEQFAQALLLTNEAVFVD